MALLPLGYPPLGLQAATLVPKPVILAYPGQLRLTLQGPRAVLKLWALCYDVMPRHLWLAA